MLLKVCVLAGSSKGNSIFVRINDDRILVDAGISARRLETLLIDLLN